MSDRRSPLFSDPGPTFCTPRSGLLHVRQAAGPGAGRGPLRRTIPREIVLIGDVEGLDDRLLQQPAPVLLRAACRRDRGLAALS
jgi:hypothetical protein